MDKNIYSYLDPGIVHFMAYPDTIKGEGPILETIERIAKDDFFSIIEVTHIKSDSIRQRAVDILRAGHLDVYYGAQPRQLLMDADLNAVEESKRCNAIKLVQECVEEAIELNAKGIGILSGNNVEGADREMAFELLTDSIKQICDYAMSKDKNLSVVMEVFDSDVDKRLLVGPVGDAKLIVEAVNADYSNFGLMVDQSHIPLLDETNEQAVKPISDYLAHVHLANCVMDRNHYAYGDNHPYFGIECGLIDVKEVQNFLKLLIDTGYLDGTIPRPVSFEVKPGANESSEVVLANAKRVLKKAWAML